MPAPEHLLTGKFPSLDLSSGSGCFGSVLSQPPWVVLSETCLGTCVPRVSEPLLPRDALEPTDGLRALGKVQE